MVQDLVRIVVFVFAVFAAFAGTRQFLSGAILVKDTDEPGFWLRRKETPVAFWAFVLSFYIVIFVIGISAIFLSME